MMKYTNTSAFYYACKGPEILFTKDWKKCKDTDFVEELIKSGSGMKCDGGGVPGPWCDRFPSCKYFGQIDRYDYEDNMPLVS